MSDDLIDLIREVHAAHPKLNVREVAKALDVDEMRVRYRNRTENLGIPSVTETRSLRKSKSSLPVRIKRPFRRIPYAGQVMK